MILMGKLTIGQKNSLLNKQFIKDGLFNPVQDDNGDWFISQEEMLQCVNPPFLWVKTLNLSEYVKTEIDPFNTQITSRLANKIKRTKQSIISIIITIIKKIIKWII